MTPTDTATKLATIAQHIARHSLDTTSVTHDRNGIEILAWRERNLRSWLDTLTDIRITAEVYDRDRVMVAAYGKADRMLIRVNYVCVADSEFDLYAFLAAQIGKSDGPVDVVLPGPLATADAETAVA